MKDFQKNNFKIGMLCNKIIFEAIFKDFLEDI